MGGRKCHAKVRRGQNNCCGGSVGGYALRGINFHNALTQSADNTPATQVGTQGNSYSTGCFNPERNSIVVFYGAGSN